MASGIPTRNFFGQPDQLRVQGNPHGFCDRPAGGPMLDQHSIAARRQREIRKLLDQILQPKLRELLQTLDRSNAGEETREPLGISPDHMQDCQELGECFLRIGPACIAQARGPMSRRTGA